MKHIVSGTSETAAFTVTRRARRLHVHGPLSFRLDMRAVGAVCVLTGVSAALLLLALMLGERTLTPVQVWQSLLGQGSPGTQLFVIEWRLPRALAAIGVGAMLGMAGALFQTLTRNPLGSPDIIGFTSGAYTGGLVSILLLSGGFAAVAVGSVLGGLATAAVIVTLSLRGGLTGFRLIIVGIGITMMLDGFDTWLLLRSDTDFAMIASIWGVGSLNSVTWTTVLPMLIAGMVTALAALPLSRGFAQLDFDDAHATVLGARPLRTKLLALVVGVILVALSTAVAGPIAFIALAAPQVGKRLAAAAGTPLLPAAVTGSALLLGADLAGQHALPDRQYPAGIVTLCIGGLYLLWLLIRETRKAHL